MTTRNHGQSPVRFRAHVVPRRAACVLVFVLTSFMGCQGGKDPLGRLPVAGTVTFQGKPLSKGMIEFLPSDAKQRLSARTLISDGKYRLPQEQGLPPGTYRVLISSPERDPTAKQVPVGPPGMTMSPPVRESIPARYNSESRLTAEVQEGRVNTFDFTIE